MANKLMIFGSDREKMARFHCSTVPLQKKAMFEKNQEEVRILLSRS